MEAVITVALRTLPGRTMILGVRVLNMSQSRMSKSTTLNTTSITKLPKKTARKTDPPPICTNRKIEATITATKSRKTGMPTSLLCLFALWLICPNHSLMSGG